jgi:hypothetical protein
LRSTAATDIIGIPLKDIADLLLAECELPNSSAPQPPPLTDIEQRVLNIIKEHPKGIQGKGIIHNVRKQGFPIAQSTLTRHIIPKLKQWYSVENRRGVGYFLPST